jgi:phosphatidate phosphatase APP1
MTNWKQILTTVVHNAEEQFDKLRYQLHERLGKTDEPVIIPYLGYGSPEKLFIHGRVIQRQDVLAADDNDTLWRNLLNTYRRLESDEVPHARIQVEFQDNSYEVIANEEGFFQQWLRVTQPLTAAKVWHTASLQLVDAEANNPVEGSVFIPSPAAKFGIISDIDDTVVQTHATHLLRMARTVFLGNARTRLPFPGVAAFYAALQAGTAEIPYNPLFYVSSSPWNLYDLLLEFFILQDIPLAPLFLRDWGISRSELLPVGHKGHKLLIIQQLLDFYQDLPFILIGDSGQEDPEIYHHIIQQNPNRILAAYIRNVTTDPERDTNIGALAQEVVAAGSTLLLDKDTYIMAQHAAANGWIAATALAGIKAAKEKDEAAPGLWEVLLEDETDQI